MEKVLRRMFSLFRTRVVCPCPPNLWKFESPTEISNDRYIRLQVVSGRGIA